MSSLGGRLQEVITYQSSDHFAGHILHMVTTETYPNLKCLIHVKCQFRKQKIRFFLLKQFPCPVLPKNAMILQHLIFQFSLYHLFNGRSLEVKNRRKKFQTYERWSLTRGSKYSDLTWKLSLFSKPGRWGEVVAHESDRNRFDCILHVILSLLVYSKPTTDDHLYNLRAKELTLGNHAMNA